MDTRKMLALLALSLLLIAGCQKGVQPSASPAEGLKTGVPAVGGGGGDAAAADLNKGLTQADQMNADLASGDELDEKFVSGMDW